MSKDEIGIITEQGDLGLGFDPLSDNDAKAYDEATSNTNTSEVITEDKNK
jgi:hypothetical protein